MMELELGKYGELLLERITQKLSGVERQSHD